MFEMRPKQLKAKPRRASRRSVLDASSPSITRMTLLSRDGPVSRRLRRSGFGAKMPIVTFLWDTLSRSHLWADVGQARIQCAIFRENAGVFEPWRRLG